MHPREDIPEENIREKLKIQFSQLKRSPNSPGLDIEGLRLLVHLENEKRKAAGEPKFNCYVLY